MFSIVIPLYNKAHTIRRTLSTVLAQTYSEFEILIVNDGSTDNGVEVIKEITNDPRLQIIDQENQGVSAARNKGASLAKRDYIAFLDGDDEWLPDYLLKMKEAIEKFPNAGLFCCAGVVRNGNGTEVSRLAEKYKGQIREVEFFENPHVFLHISASVVSKKQFDASGGFKLGMKRNEDFAFFYSYALLTTTVYCGFPLSIYIGGIEGQSTSTPLEKVLPHVIKRFNYVFDTWNQTGFKNKTFPIFIKYELRHYFKINLQSGNYGNNELFLQTLNPGLVRLFTGLELMLLKSKNFKKLSVLYINLTKLRWRLRGYPTSGQ